MPSTVKATSAFRSVQQQAEKIKSDEPHRFPEAASANDYHRQGDVLIWKLDAMPAGCVLDTKPNAQLAPGDTQGSRHILDSLAGVEIFQRQQRDALQGPILRTSTERTITHPEHGDVILPAGCYEITYQRQFAEELRRVQD
jgi:hypothetical protein